MDQVSATGRTITLVHFVSEVIPPLDNTEHKESLVTQWRISCMPNMIEFHATSYHPNYQRTDDVRAVSCPQCMKSLAFRQAQERLNTAVLRRLTNVK